jgi:hypothetical protein
LVAAAHPIWFKPPLSRSELLCCFLDPVSRALCRFSQRVFNTTSLVHRRFDGIDRLLRRSING